MAKANELINLQGYDDGNYDLKTNINNMDQLQEVLTTLLSSAFNVSQGYDPTVKKAQIASDLKSAIDQISAIDSQDNN